MQVEEEQSHQAWVPSLCLCVSPCVSAATAATMLLHPSEEESGHGGACPAHAGSTPAHSDRRKGKVRAAAEAAVQRREVACVARETATEREGAAAHSPMPLLQYLFL